VAEQEQNRSEEATPFKLQEARRQGQVAKSLDVNSVVMLLALLGMLAAGGVVMWERLGVQMQALFVAAGTAGDHGGHLLVIAGAMMRALLWLLAPLFVVCVIAAIAANFVQTGPILSFVPLKPKWERLSPVAGFKRVFNKRMLMEAFKSILKFVILGWITVAYLRAHAEEIAGMWTYDSGDQARWMAGMLFGLLLRLVAALVVIGLLDLIFSRRQFRKQMMMSRRELKEEIKRREGDPQIRAKLKELQRENLKQAASLKRVPEADVLITNPQHVAIALRYERDRMLAPQVIAKGCDDWALKMRQKAREAGIPIYERRSLARTLLKRAAVDAAIPPECYVDVARIYAEVDAARRRLVRYEVRA
jgi:flagellar biosynthesis protein FlhB